MRSVRATLKGARSFLGIIAVLHGAFLFSTPAQAASETPYAELRSDDVLEQVVRGTISFRSRSGWAASIDRIKISDKGGLLYATDSAEDFTAVFAIKAEKGELRLLSTASQKHKDLIGKLFFFGFTSREGAGRGVLFEVEAIRYQPSRERITFVSTQNGNERVVEFDRNSRTGHINFSPPSDK